jgi:hypothetical protein
MALRGREISGIGPCYPFLPRYSPSLLAASLRFSSELA